MFNVKWCICENESHDRPNWMMILASDVRVRIH